MNMKKILSLLLVFFLFMTIHSEENDYRIGFFWVWKNRDKQPPALLWQQMDSLRCNYGHFGRYKNAFQFKKILDTASRQNFFVQTQWEPIYGAHHYSTRMVFFAGKWNDKRYFFTQNDPQSRTTGNEIVDSSVLTNLPDEIDVQKRTVIHCQPFQHQEGFITRHLIDDRYPENWIYQVRLDDKYHLKTRLRIRLQDNLPASTPIVRVACVKRSSREVVAEKTITLQDFPILASGKYEEIELLPFQRPYVYKNLETGKYVDNPANPNNFKRIPATLDFIAFWNGRIETWFDYVKLDSDRAHQLFKGNLDENLINGMNQFKDHPALQHLLLKDEPEYAFFRPGNYLDKLLKENSNARGMSVNNKEMFNEEYVLLEGLPEYVVDAYPIRGYMIPVPPQYSDDRRGAIDDQLVPTYINENAYNDSLQKAFNQYFFQRMNPAREASNKYRLPIWYCPQTFSQKSKAENRIKYRCPTPEELEATVYLALAYGVKGLFYFQYMNMSQDKSYIGGVVNDQLQHTDKTARTKWGETFYIGNDLLWDTLLRLNPQAEKILSITQNLTFVSQFNETNLQSPFQNITNWNRELSGNIHFSTFRDDQNDIYFMIVNKQCHPNAGQQFTLNLSLGPNRNYIIRDLLGENNFDLRTNATGKSQFNITIGPGKGLLYKLFQTE